MTSTVVYGPQLRPMPSRVAFDDVRRLAFAIVGNTAYTQYNVPEPSLHMVFLPVLFGALDGYVRRQLDQLVVFAVRDRHRTTGMAHNGLPTFAECAIWPREDFETAVALAKCLRDVATEPA